MNMQKSLEQVAVKCIEKAVELLEIEKAKGKTTVTKEKKEGNYIGFNKLVNQLKNKTLPASLITKSISELGTAKIDELIKACENLDDINSNKDYLSKSISIEKGKVNNPAALAAFIGRKKYGNKKFQEMAEAGKKKVNKTLPSDKNEELKGPRLVENVDADKYNGKDTAEMQNLDAASSESLGTGISYKRDNQKKLLNEQF